MQKKEVIGYVIATEEWLQFESINHAAEHFDIPFQSVWKVIRGDYKQVKGICFHYNTEDFDEQIMAKLNREDKRGGHSKKTVLVKDLQGNRVAEYKGIREAARQLGISITTVSQCANGLRGNANYKFELV